MVKRMLAKTIEFWKTVKHWTDVENSLMSMHVSSINSDVMIEEIHNVVELSKEQGK